jgi:hypothetical protein
MNLCLVECADHPIAHYVQGGKEEKTPQKEVGGTESKRIACLETMWLRIQSNEKLATSCKIRKFLRSFEKNRFIRT